MKCPKCGFENTAIAQRCEWAFCSYEFISGKKVQGEDSVMRERAGLPAIAKFVQNAILSNRPRLPLSLLAGVALALFAATMFLAPAFLVLFLACLIAFSITLPALLVMTPERLIMNVRQFDKQADEWVPHELHVIDPALDYLGRIWWAGMWRKIVIAPVGAMIFTLVTGVLLEGIPLNLHGIYELKETAMGIAKNPMAELFILGAVEFAVWLLILGKNFNGFRLVIVMNEEIVWTWLHRIVMASVLTLMGTVVTACMMLAFAGEHLLIMAAVLCAAPFSVLWLVMKGPGTQFGLVAATRAAFTIANYEGSWGRAYAEFWKRRGAFLLDCAVIAAISLLVGLGVALVFGTWVFQERLLVFSGLFIICWIYWAGMEGSRKQATLGKLLFRIAVTDLAGGRVSFGRTAVRALAKTVCAIVPGLQLSFLMAAATEEKKALHDIWAETLVLKKAQEVRPLPQWAVLLSTPVRDIPYGVIYSRSQTRANEYFKFLLSFLRQMALLILPQGPRRRRTRTKRKASK